MSFREDRSHKLGHGVLSFLGSAVFACIVLAFWAAPALAIETHPFTGVSIGPDGKTASINFTSLGSVALDSASGDLYVLDVSGNGRLYKFDGEGEPLNFSGTGSNFIEGTGGFKGDTTVNNQVAIAPTGAVGGTAGDIYIANSEVLKIYSPAGTEIGQIAVPEDDTCGVAVDPAGNVFTKSQKNTEDPIVRKYTPATNPPTDAEQSGESAVFLQDSCNLSVDSKGHIYAASVSPRPNEGSAQHPLWRLESITAGASEVFDPQSSAVAVEPVTDNVYVSRGTEVIQRSEGGSVIAEFGKNRLDEAPGLSVGSPGGDVFVANRAAEFAASPPVWPGRVEIYGPLTDLPKAVASPASGITKTSAVLNGTISADGGPTATCEFEYTTQSAFQRQNETQRLAITASGGTFALSFEGQGTGWQGTGELHNNAEVTGFVTSAGELVQGEELSGPGIVPGTLIEAVLPAEHRLILSQSATASGTTTLLAALPYKAEARTIEAALKALSTIGANGVTVTGGPVGNGALFPYTITFNGPLAAQNLKQISADSSQLTGGGPSAEVRTVTEGQAGGFAGATNAPCAPGGPFTGSAPEPVSAEITGLVPGTEYRYRLVGKNANGSLASDENGSASGEAPSFQTLVPFAVQTAAATNLTTTSATLNGSINPEGVVVNECFFEFEEAKEFAETGEYQGKAPCKSPDGSEIGSGTQPVAVHADLSGLTEGTEYDFRLVSGTSEFGGIVIHGGNVPLGTLGLPEIITQSFSQVGQFSATVSGSLNPRSSRTTYYVEYVTQGAFAEGEYTAAIKVPLEGETIGSGFTPVDVSQGLTGLSPGTKYHFRLFAENGIGHVKGPDGVFITKDLGQLFGSCPANEVFRVEASALLPDCRAYEQASSPDKNGGGVGGIYTQMLAAEDGSGVTFYSPNFSLPPSERGGTQSYATYLASRNENSGSWSSQRLLPPQEFGGLAEFLGASPDLRYAVVEAGSTTGKGLFLIDTGTGSVTSVVSYQPPTGPKEPQFGLDGITSDGSRVFFESIESIPTIPSSPSPAAGRDNLYMWERSTGAVSLVGVLPSNEGASAPPAGSFGGSYEWYSSSNPSSGGALNHPVNAFIEPMAVAALNAISPIGDQVFFTAAGTGQLYLRRGLSGSAPTTVHISTPNRGVSAGSGEKPAAFQEATPSGGRAFFISSEKLTADATTGEKEEGVDLYRWDSSAATGKGLVDITPDPGDPNGAEVQGLLGAAPDGSSGYFVARGVLGNAGEKGVEEPGGENLYRFSEEPGGHFKISFIATLAKGGEASPDRRNVSPKVFINATLGRTSRLSEDGETLLFASTEPLTGYDNFSLKGISCQGGRCPELYRYSAQTENVVCISCDPTNEAPLGAATLQDPLFNAFFVPTEAPAVSFSRSLSADGTRVFFQTPDSLVAADNNAIEGCPALGGNPGTPLSPGRCQDVYEWEAVGSGSCQHEEANGGCLYLLSTGSSDKPSYFIGASKDGSSAFIATTSKLVPVDRDEADDVYDVREGGGLASQHAIPQPACDSAEACKAPTSSPPLASSPATSSFQGPGNVKVAACKKGFVPKGSRCVKKPAAKKPKHHKKKHHGKKRSTAKKSSGGAK